MSPFGSTSSATGGKLVGFSPGSPSPSPTSTDLSAALPLLITEPVDSRPLALATGAPRIGSVVPITTSWIPSPGIAISFLSWAPNLPPVDLTSNGMPGCFQHADPLFAVLSILLVGTGTQTANLAIPNDTVLVGLSLYSQSVAIDPPANSLGLTSSNGVTLTFGTVF